MFVLLLEDACDALRLLGWRQGARSRRDAADSASSGESRGDAQTLHDVTLRVDALLLLKVKHRLVSTFDKSVRSHAKTKYSTL